MTEFQTATCERCGATWETRYRPDEQLPASLLCAACVLQGAKPKPAPKPRKPRVKRPPLVNIDKHGCEHKHRTYAAVARCRWRRARSISGEGRYGAYVEPDYHYGNGTAAVWPHITLFGTADEAYGFLASRDVSAVRRMYGFEFPADPGDAINDGPYTLEGNRARYALTD